MVLNPLAEVFGFPITNFNKDANRTRQRRLCPYNNRVPSCTKDKANDPLGVCSIFSDDDVVITCPVRFRQNWTIADNAADFFFAQNTTWTSLTEVSLEDATGKTAGHIDLVLVSYDARGKVIDFGSVEIQAVYISGNIRHPFEYYMEKPSKRSNFDWHTKPNYPKPDFLSSSRKRLLPQVLYKGGILNAWNKKQAVVLQKSFFETLPEIPVVDSKAAEIAWFLYDLKKDQRKNVYNLEISKTVYTQFHPAMQKISTAPAGRIEDFIETLQQKLDNKLEGNPPDTHTLGDIVLT
jgi:hypothetical protein